jgi:hypothetical protein
MIGGPDAFRNQAQRLSVLPMPCSQRVGALYTSHEKSDRIGPTVRGEQPVKALKHRGVEVKFIDRLNRSDLICV